MGLQLTAKSCFDVREAPALWGMLELMSDSPLETDRDLEFLSSHPTHGARQESLASQLHRALEIRCNNNADMHWHGGHNISG